MTVTDSTFKNNSVLSTGQAQGGAIDNEPRATMTLSNDTFYQNNVSGNFALGGGVDDFGTSSVTSSTFYDNSAQAKNPVDAASGIEVAGTMTLFNTIVYDGQGGVDVFVKSIQGPSGDGNLIGTSSGVSSSVIATTDNPDLGPFQNNGGPTSSFALKAGSPAIDAGDSSQAASTDQRGFARIAGSAIDIGSYEYSAPVLVTSAADSGPGTLRAAIATIAADRLNVPIEFATSLSGATITLASPLGITTQISIDGSGAPGLAISGGGSTQVFAITPAGNLSLTNLTVENGYALTGAGISNSGTLTLQGVTVSGNRTEINQLGTYGAGLYNAGTATVTDSTFSQNNSGGGGGAIYNSGKLTLLDDTIAANTAGLGGGLDQSGKATIRDTILAGNQLFNNSPNGADVLGPFTSGGHNLIGVSSGVLQGSLALTDLHDVNADLGPLLSNGGPTNTMALSLGSPAIDAGDPTGLPADDQRGFVRILNGQTDIGAYQTEVILTLAASTTTFGGITTFTATLTDQGEPLAGQTIAFTNENHSDLIVGTGVTNASGVATFEATLGLAVGVHSGTSGMTAIFAPASNRGSLYNSATAATIVGVAPAPLTIVIANASMKYGSLSLPSFTGQVTGLVDGDTLGSGVTVSYSTTARVGSDAGQYGILATVGGSDISNYKVTVEPGILTILPATPRILWAAPNAITYGTPLGAAQLDAIITATDGGAVTYSPPLGTILPAGNGYTLTVNIAATKDYVAASDSVSLNVNLAPLVITAENAVMVAGGPMPAFAAIYNGFVNGDGPSSLTTPVTFDPTSDSSSPPGQYPIGIGGATSPNYAILFIGGTLTVESALSQPSVAISDPSGPYTGQPVQAVATVTGINGIPGSSLEGVSPSVAYYAGTIATGMPLPAPPTSIGAYTAVASFPGSTDYTSGSAQLTFDITQATPTLNVLDSGGTYDGSAFPATVTVSDVLGNTGTSLEGVTPTLAYYAGTSSLGTRLSGAPTEPGTYTAVGTFAGSADYTSNTGQATFTIADAVPSLSVSDAGGTYDGSPYPASVTLSGIDGVPVSSLGGVAPVLSYYSGTTQLSGAPKAAGTYVAQANFSGGGDYAANSAQVTFTIADATPNLSISDLGGPFDNSQYPAKTSISGTTGLPGASLESTSLSVTYYASDGTQLPSAPTTAGNYTAIVSFPGSADYSTANKRVTFTIAQVTPTVSISAPGGTYNGSAYTATATVTGIDGNPVATLEGVAPTLTYYEGPTATGTPLVTPPTEAGTYTVQADFAGSTDYTAASTTATFTILQAPLSYTVTDASQLYGDSTPTLSGNFTGLVTGDSITATLSTDATSLSPVGNYPITATLVDPDGLLANYAVSITPGTLTIDPQTLTVTATDEDMNHGGALPFFGYGIQGFVNNDGDSVISGSPAFTTTATGASGAGQYPIDVNVAGLSATNYVFNWVPATLTVHPVVEDVRVLWGSQSMSILGLTRDLPFADITGLEVIYSDPIQSPSLSAMGLSAVSGTATPPGFQGVSQGPAGANEYIWSLPATTPLGVDMLTATLNPSQISALVNGNAIGLGGTNAFNLDVLPGDYNGDRTVTTTDAIAIRNAIATANVWADLNGDGVVNASDVTIALRNSGTKLPASR